MGDMLMGDTSPVKRQKMCNEAFCLKICSKNKDVEIQLVNVEIQLENSQRSLVFELSWG